MITETRTKSAESDRRRAREFQSALSVTMEDQEHCRGSIKSYVE